MTNMADLIPNIEALVFASDRPLTTLEITELINNAFDYLDEKILLDQVEVALEGIRVNAVRPGVISTDIHEHRSVTQMTELEKAIPLGRFGTPEEIAEAIVWLASPAASYVIGALLDARGGY